MVGVQYASSFYLKFNQPPPRTNMGSFIESHIGQVDEAKDENFGYAMQLALSSVLPMTMYSAIQLGIFEIIAKAGPDAKLSASDVAAQLPTKNPDAPMMLDRILRLLASHDVLGCSVDGSERLYSLAPVSKHYVRNKDGVSLGPFMALIQDNVFLQSWFVTQFLWSHFFIFSFFNFYLL